MNIFTIYSYEKGEKMRKIQGRAYRKLCPGRIEVKSERNTKSKSLAAYRKQYDPRISIRISNVPLYMLWRIEDYVPWLA